MAHRTRVQQMTVGLVVLTALLIFAGSILIIGQETRLFVSSNTYRSNFGDASGLRVGSPVTVAGVRVGTITRIVLPTDPGSQGIEVFLSVDDDYAGRIREGTLAKVVYLQIVANEKAVDLSPGNPEGPQLPDGAFIPPAPSDEFLETGRSIADTLEQVTADLKEILGAIRRGEGLLGRAIFDPRFGEEGLAKIDASLASLGSILREIERGEGLLGRTISDEEFAERFTTDLETTVSGLSRIVTRLEAGEGAVGRLLAPGESEALIEDARASLASMRRVTEGLESGEGTLGRLLRDDEYGARVSENLDLLIERLASIATKIDEGQGTLGQLVNEPSLHDDVQELITGVRKSKLMSWLIRRYHRKGEKALDTQ